MPRKDRVITMTKRVSLSDDFLGTVKALLNTPPPPKKAKAVKAKGKKKAKKPASKRGKKA